MSISPFSAARNMVFSCGSGDKSLAKSSAGLLEIDLSAVRANYALLQAQLRTAQCAGVVKADAYGLGAAYIAPALYAEGCRHFFVAHFDEALALRPALPEDSALYVLNGLAQEAVGECAHAAIIPVLNSVEQLAAWSGEARRLERFLPAVVQIDTGMSRLGLSWDEIKVLAQDPLAFSGLKVHFGMSHLACADEPMHPANGQQLLAFREGQLLLKTHQAFAHAKWSLANSAGIFLGSDFHFDIVRPGIALYGINPQPEKINVMQPVVRLMARVIQKRAIQKGTYVGYGYSFTAQAPTRMAVLSVGYADGWLRSLSRCGAAWLGKHRLPIIGRVSMDSVAVDISSVPEDLIQPDTLVELIGDQQTADKVAESAGTIAYEILTSLGQRYHRIYKE